MADNLNISAGMLLHQATQKLDQSAKNIASGQGAVVGNMVGLVESSVLMDLGGTLIGVQKQTSGRVVDLLS